MNSLRFACVIIALLPVGLLGHPELFQLPWILPSLDPSNSFAATAQRPPQAFAPAPQPLAQQQLQAFAPAPQPTAQQVLPQQQPYPQQLQAAPQQNFGYLPRSEPLPAPAPAHGAFGVAQRPQSQPLPPDSERLAPFQAAATPVPAINFPTQYPPAQPAYQSNSITAQPFVAPPQQPAATREPPVQNFWFKEGTPVLPCGYGLPPPEYNTPRKRCVPFSPLCGFAFSCIMDV